MLDRGRGRPAAQAIAKAAKAAAAAHPAPGQQDGSGADDDVEVQPCGKLLLRNTGDGANYVFQCDGIVIHNNQLMAASIAGPGVAVKALRASLYGKASVKPSFDWTKPGETWPKETYVGLAEGGVKCSKPHKMSYGLFHVAIVARTPTLLHSRYPEALWQHLEKTTTTPIRREWMSWIAEALKATKRLVHPDLEHNLSMAICTADDDVLDKIVMAAVSSGRVKI